jgi:Mrp family chromosome partitioning ATPase
MERIRHAVEKARQRRAMGPTRPTVERIGRRPHPVDVSYSRTRTTALSPRTLIENRIIAGFENRAEADLYRMLRTQVSQRLSRLGGTTLAVSSAHRGEGKTVTAVNLAISLSMDVNHTVLLVDLDLRAPSVSTVLGLKAELGLESYLTGAAEVADCLVNPGMDRLVVLPTLAPVHGSSEILASPRMASLAQELRGRYPDRLIIYDLPPLLAADDSLVFMEHVDGLLLVVEHGATRSQELERILSMIDGKKLIGTVLNKARGNELGIEDYG